MAKKAKRSTKPKTKSKTRSKLVSGLSIQKEIRKAERAIRRLKTSESKRLAVVLKRLAKLKPCDALTIL